MASGMEWAITALANFMGLTPESVKKQLADSAQIILGLDNRLRSIEAQNAAIMSRLGIAIGATISTPNETNEGHDGQLGQIANGAGICSGDAAQLEPAKPAPGNANGHAG